MPDDAVTFFLAHQDRVPAFVIYRPVTKDFPGRWIARVHLTLPTPEPTPHYILAPTLRELRRALPRGLLCLARDPADDPVIEEVWL